MRRLIAATAAGSLAVAAALFGALPASAADPAEVYVVHGIPGLPVDVYVNGALTLDDFQPETVAGPLDLPAGSYAIATISAGETRIVVRHDAAAPAVDVRAGGTVVLAGVTNPQEGVLNIPAGTVSADVVLAGTTTVAIGPASLNLAEGSATFVHAVGSAEDGTLALVSFTIAGLHSAPGGVPAGTGPADSSLPGIALIVLLTAGLSVAAVGGRRLY